MEAIRDTTSLGFRWWKGKHEIQYIWEKELWIILCLYLIVTVSDILEQLNKDKGQPRKCSFTNLLKFSN